MTAPDNTTHASAAAHRPFNEAVIDCPLTGVRLVEASAGTGKTFQIQTLFLRLVVLEGITVCFIYNLPKWSRIFGSPRIWNYTKITKFITSFLNC